VFLSVSLTHTHTIGVSFCLSLTQTHTVGVSRAGRMPTKFSLRLSFPLFPANKHNTDVSAQDCVQLDYSRLFSALSLSHTHTHTRTPLVSRADDMLNCFSLRLSFPLSPANTHNTGCSREDFVQLHYSRLLSLFSFSLSRARTHTHTHATQVFLEEIVYASILISDSRFLCFAHTHTHIHTHTHTRTHTSQVFPEKSV